MGQNEGRIKVGKPAEKARTSLEDALQQALAGLRYGSVEITVHNARVVQIERRERFRLELEEEGFAVMPSLP